ncbi:MAG: flagellar biosynthesis protein FlhF [Gammaproteobacteria bacterium]
MKIKRYFAPDIRTAIRQVREQQGPDAVILSNRSVEGGVEIVAAVDYDEQALLEQTRQQQARRARTTESGAGNAQEAARPATPDKGLDEPEVAASFPGGSRFASSGGADNYWSQDPLLSEMRRELNSMRDLLEHQLSGLAWGEMARGQPHRMVVLKRLMNLGLSSRLAKRITNELSDTGDADLLWRRALGVLAHAIPIAQDDILTDGGVIALVGPTGVGKTTMVAKLAARFCLQHGRHQVALLTTDNYRIGAHEQLRTYGRILDVPVRVVEEKEDLGGVMADFADRRLILIDTAGIGQRDRRLPEHLAMLEDRLMPIRRYLVLSATTDRAALREAVGRFGASPLAGCMLTKLDETARLASALSVVVEERLPVSYVGDGQRVPEDLAPARAHNLVSAAVSATAQLHEMAAGTAEPERVAVHGAH